MTVETKADNSDQITTTNWGPKARRQGEGASWGKTPQTAAEARKDVGGPPISPPPIWPRVFPGI